MCGIAGLYSKRESVAEQLGALVAGMLTELGERGPDSVGVAVYRDPAPAGARKLTLHTEDPLAWEALVDLWPASELRTHGRHAVLVTDAAAPEVAAVLAAAGAPVRVMSAGEAIEIYKEKGNPAEFVAGFALDERLRHARPRAHAHGDREPRHHRALASVLDRARPLPRAQRLALQPQPPARPSCAARASSSAPTTTPRSRPATSPGGCARAPRSSRRSRAACAALDGFYTFAVGTRDGFAVLRDPFACKPAVLAETDDWVAMASEFRAIAILPDAADANVWEPAPGEVYSWRREAVLAL